MPRHLDDLQLGGSEGQFLRNNAAKNTVRFRGSRPPRWRWKFGDRNNTTIFDNIDIGDDSPMD